MAPETAALEAPRDAHFRALAEAIPQLAWIAEADGEIHWYNRRWYDYTGTDLEQMRGWGWKSVHDPAMVADVEAKFRVALETGRPWQDTFPLRGRDGTFRWFLSRAEPIRDETGAIIRWFGTNTDVHESRLSEDRFRAAIDAIQGVLWTNDATGRMVGPQPGWASLTGQTQAEYEGFGWADAVHPEDAQPSIDEWNASVAGRRPFIFEHRVRRASGEWGHFAIRAIPVIEADGSIREWVGVHTDITGLRAAEAALRASNEEMQRYTHMVSHDLRSPLVNVMGYTSELTDLRPALFPDPADPNTADVRRDFDESIHFIRSSTERMDRLLSAILRLSREGQRALTPVDLDMDDLVRRLLEGQQHQVSEARAEVTVQPLPPLRADRAAVEQVLGNLIDNAIKYRAVDRPLQITVSGEARDGRVRLHVADTGRGIDKAQQGRAFQLFRRIGPQTVPGEGVGLAYVQALTRAMGGAIELESEAGVGSRFTVSLPAAAAPAA
ncbi:MAG: PAS domain-containing sensor histidine kinase [Caulobacteraceae bacterium]|nr:PAS domain-containing sensor histidine kinase [Caulobacter sp.]